MERKRLAAATMPTTALETQRDIFVFQCLVGCRVSDLMLLTESNIYNGVLTYVPKKTSHKGRPQTASVPLTDEALRLVEKYKGKDCKGRLFPYYASQKYNAMVKEAFKIAGIDREVNVKDPKTGEIKMQPLYEVASSHMARRTFIGNIYNKVSDPNIIGSMSGHVEGSRAFARYRNIDDEIRRNAIKALE